MSVWFEGSSEINCGIERIREGLADFGELSVGVTRHMPGMRSVELVKNDGNTVIVKTNEGLMERSNISVSVESDGAQVTFDENYKAGRATTVTSRHAHHFSPSQGTVLHRAVVSDVKGSGLLGFLYRHFARWSMKRAIVKSYKDYFEAARWKSRVALAADACRCNE